MNDPSFFQNCHAAQLALEGNTQTFVSNSTALLECVSNRVEDDMAVREASLKSFLMIISGALVFFMQAGFAVLCAGNVRVKNVQNTMLKNLLDACGAAIAFFLLGYGLAFGGQDASEGASFLGTQDFFSTGPSAATWFFHFTFSATSVTIVAGTLAERCQMAAYLLYSILLSGFIYPIVVHAVWSENGFLSSLAGNPLFRSGVLDFAGSGVVHLTGGSVAFYATLILGPRRGRFFDSQGVPLDEPKEMPGHSTALQLLGTMILWFGWFGFNGGSALLVTDNDNVGSVAANAAVSTALAGAGGGVTALFTNLYFEEKRTGEPSFSLKMAMNGALGGLVSITAGCALVEPWAALVTGMMAGWIYMWGSNLLVRFKIDDAVDAIPVHMFNGIWGLIGAGLFASPRKMELTYGHLETASGHVGSPGFFYSLGSGDFNIRLLGSQLVGILFIVGWTFVTMFPFFVFLNYQGWFRADSLEELVGLDISYHGGALSGGGDSGVKKEYLEAFNRKRGKPATTGTTASSTGSSKEGGRRRKNRQRANRGADSADVESYLSQSEPMDPDVNQEAAAWEAEMED